MRVRNNRSWQGRAMAWMLLAGCGACSWSLGPSAWAAAALPTVMLEEMTSPELQTRMEQGTDTVLVPIGGTEQNGPHMVLGKHNARVRWLAQEIARKLGHTVVAPVMAYVPEGAIHPPQAHMRFSGTLSIPESAFEAVLEGTARSLAQHGFRTIVFLGDHGGYQQSEVRVATKLNKAWQSQGAGGARVLALLDYYRVTQQAYAQLLKQKGYAPGEIGTHAGLADTALTLAVDPSLVRRDVLSTPRQWALTAGVSGDPSRATAELGQWGVQQMVDTSVQAIQAFSKTK